MGSEFSFEKAMERMDEIIALLEDGRLDLDKSLEVFEEGIKLYRCLTQRLKEAEGRVKLIMEGQDGIAEEFDFEPEGENDHDL